MSKLFYERLAFNNIKNNRKTYIPFIITAVITIIMMYNISAINYHSRTATSASLSSMLSLGTIITAIFTAVLLLYTNSFLVKRRCKEFGLYNIFGMEKKHIGRIMMWENLFVAAFSIISGIVLGIVFNKLVTLLFYKILNFDPTYGFEINLDSIIATVILFAIIFILIFLNTLRQIHMSKPIELLKGSETGEKEPKTKIFLTIFGFVTLIAGYTIALVIKTPMAAFGWFFIAVILVIIGTYCLFAAGSIAILKLLKRNKNYYYKTNHFTSISGMLYRMKRNAVGLANICILSTAVLVTLSTTVSMYVGIEDILKTRFPADICITSANDEESNFDRDALENEVLGYFKDNGIEPADFRGFGKFDFIGIRDADNIYVGKSNSLTAENAVAVVIIEQNDYKKLSGLSVSLKENEVLVYDNLDLTKDKLNLLGKEFVVREKVDVIKYLGEQMTYISNVVMIVVPDSDCFNSMYGVYKQEAETEISQMSTYELFVDLNSSDEEKLKVYDDLSEKLPQTVLRIDSRLENKADFYVLYGGLFFIGIFIGSLFLIATVLIIYYKQIVEGFEDKERFEIMQKVGMSRVEVKKSIHSQILTVFALPLLAAVVHIVVAFPILTKLLSLLNLNNVPLFTVCTIVTILIFAVIYAVVYFLTAKVYDKIVNSK